MRFVSLVSLAMILCSAHAVTAPDDLKDACLDDYHPRGVFKYEGPAPGGLTRGTFIPDNPGPMWKRLRVFIPSINIRMLKASLIAGTIPAYFLVRKYFSDTPSLADMSESQKAAHLSDSTHANYLGKFVGVDEKRDVALFENPSRDNFTIRFRNLFGRI